MLRYHIEELVSSWKKLWDAPWTLALTLLMIGITLALPAGLSVLLENISTLNKEFDANIAITAYITPHTSKQDITDIQNRIKPLAGIQKIEFISAQQAIEAFSQTMQLENPSQYLKEAPLPASLIIELQANIPLQQATAINQALQNETAIDKTVMDLEWIQKIQQVFLLLNEISLGLMTLIAIGVLLVITNTTRLTVEREKDSIEVAKLLGATDNFIRRNYLYQGMWLGLLGGMVAWIIIQSSSWLLSTSIAELTTLFNSTYIFQGLNLENSLSLFAISILLGISGAWFALNKTLWQMIPR